MSAWGGWHWVTLGEDPSFSAALAQSTEMAQEAQDGPEGRIWAEKSGFGQDSGVTAELE